MLQDGQYERDGPAGGGVKTSGRVRGTPPQEESACSHQGANRSLGGHRDEAAGPCNGGMAAADGGRNASRRRRGDSRGRGWIQICAQGY